jgi:hypothetical protein
MTTDPVDDPEPEDEVDTILAHLVAERTDAQTPTLALHQIALLHKAAILMTSGTADDVKDLNTLLSLAPKILRPGARPTPTLAQACRSDAPWDLSRLSNQQLLDLEIIASVAQGRACPLPTARHEALLDLVVHLDGDGAVDVPRVRESITAVLGDRVSTDVLYPSRAAELQAARARCADLEEEVERLKRQLAAVPSNVVALRRDAAAAATAASAVAAVPAPHGFVGDHEGYR